MKAKAPDNEVTSLEALRIDTEAAFDDISRLAALICGTPVALVRLVDRDRQWYKPKVGWAETESSDQIVFCAYTIKQNGLFIVEDATSDKRFATAPLVISDPKIRFYAGAALVRPDGLPLGTLCVMDYIPRSLSLEQQEALQVLSRQVITQLELQRNLAKLERNKNESKYAEQALQNVYDELEKRNAELSLAKEELQNAIASLQMAEEELHQQNDKLVISRQAIETERQRYQDLFDFGSDAYLLTDANGIIQEVNFAATVLLNVSQKHLVGKPLSMFLYKQERQIFLTKLKNMQSVQNWEVLLQPRRGVPVPAAIAVAAVYDLQGKMLGWRWQIRDLTERKRTEKEPLQLIEREQTARNQIANILESITDGFFALDKEWRFTYLNQQAERFFRRTREELIGKNVWDEFPEAVDYQSYQQYHKAVSEQINVFFEEFYAAINTWVEIHAYPGENGLSIYFHDITKHKLAEKALRTSEERFGLIAQATNDVVWDWDILTDSVWRNEGNQTLFGYCAEQIKPDIRWWYENIHPEDRERVLSGIHSLIETDESFWSDSYRYRRADGSYSYVFDRGYVMRDEQGKAIRMIGGMTDICDRKWAEQKIREQAALLNITTDAIVVRSLENKILFWNQGAERLYGWAEEEVIGKNATEILYKE
ncbi:MAG TPA: PAS domain S-box protein, partial [Candidatus Obscuribacterales bacterium]